MKLITFEQIFSTKPQSPSVVLVEGDSGTLKSTLCFSVMMDMLKDPEDYGLYVTLEQTWISHLVNMKSFGFQPPENLLSVDYNIMRKEIGDQETMVSIFNSILNILDSLYKEKEGRLKVFALDSLNASYSIMDRSFIEFSLVPFFRKLRTYDLTSLIIYEKSQHNKGNQFRERYLADGIVSLGVLHNRNDVVRYLQALKYNASDHSLKKRHIDVGKNGLSLLGTVYQ